MAVVVNIIYLQRCKDGVYRSWEQGAFVVPKRPEERFICEEVRREDAVLKTFDYNQQHGAEYGIVELDPEPLQNQDHDIDAFTTEQLILELKKHPGKKVHFIDPRNPLISRAVRHVNLVEFVTRTGRDTIVVALD
jgi:hypothetical protein